MFPTAPRCPHNTSIMQVSRCGNKGMQWPLFSLLVCATKASLETCQEEVSVCLQAPLRGGSSYGERNWSGGNLAQLGKQQVGKQHVLPHGWGRNTGSVKPGPTIPLSFCPLRCPALRQHLQLCPCQESQLHSGGVAPRRGHAEIRQGAHPCLGSSLTSQRPLTLCLISVYPTLPPPKTVSSPL